MSTSTLLGCRHPGGAEFVIDLGARRPEVRQYGLERLRHHPTMDRAHSLVGENCGRLMSQAFFGGAQAADSWIARW